jgi:competence protein ComEC
VIAIGYRWFSTKTTHRFQTFLIAIIGFQALLFFEKYQTAQQQEMVVFHKTKETIIGFKESKNSRILHSFDTINIHKLQFLINYKVGTNSNEIQLEKPIPNILFYRNKKILIIDSLGVYKSISFQPDIVLLRQSPKINLERLIHKWQPEIIIADGSNYKSYVSFWQKTCQDKHINFHYTGENGAFILKR